MSVCQQVDQRALKQVPVTRDQCFLDLEFKFADKINVDIIK